MAVETKQALYMVYMHSGTNPFEVITQAVKYGSKDFFFPFFPLQFYCFHYKLVVFDANPWW